MRPSTLMFAYCLLLPATLLPAQSGAAPQDQISGTWTGNMGPNETSRHTMTVTLKFDGKSAVSGTITGPQLTPGDIKTGTFDPKTGALKFQVVVQGDGMIVTFEGTAVQGTATGRVIFPDQSGTFKMSKGAGEPAPQPAGSDAASELRRSFGEVSGWVAKAAELVPADQYVYRPAPSVRSFGQLIGHIADSYRYYCGRAAGRDLQWSDAIEKGNTGKATVLPTLRQSLDACTAAYGGTGRIGALIDNVGHTSLHYGNIITYLRMLGLTPPSS